MSYGRDWTVVRTDAQGRERVTERHPTEAQAQRAADICNQQNVAFGNPERYKVEGKS